MNDKLPVHLFHYATYTPSSKQIGVAVIVLFGRLGKWIEVSGKIVYLIIHQPLMIGGFLTFWGFFFYHYYVIRLHIHPTKSECRRLRLKSWV